MDRKASHHVYTKQPKSIEKTTDDIYLFNCCNYATYRSFDGLHRNRSPNERASSSQNIYITQVAISCSNDYCYTYFIWIATKTRNILVNPFYGLFLIQNTIVSVGILGGSSSEQTLENVCEFRINVIDISQTKYTSISHNR